MKENKFSLKGSVIMWGHQYNIDITYDIKNKYWYVESDSIWGCAGDGDTIEQAIVSYMESLEIHFRAIIESGYELPCCSRCFGSDKFDRLKEYVWNQEWYKEKSKYAETND